MHVLVKRVKMDIDLLSKMVKEVVMDHDSVTLPGLGSFVTEIVPATFTDRGYTILPPYRRLFFSPKQENDKLLVEIYMKSNPGASESDATRILVEFLQEMKEVLKVRKTIIFPGLGRLRATKENNFFFVADEDLDIYPAGFGLQPISLKTHEETPEEVAEAVSSLADILEADPKPQPEPVAEPVAEPEPAAQPEPVEEPTESLERDPLVEKLVEAISAPVVEEITEVEPVEPVAEPEPEPEPAAEPEPEAEPESQPEPVTEPEPEPAAEDPQPAADSLPEPIIGIEEAPKTGKWIKVTLLVICGIIIVVALTLAIMGRVNPMWLDQYLYSPEELEILYPGKL